MNKSSGRLLRLVTQFAMEMESSISSGSTSSPFLVSDDDQTSSLQEMPSPNLKERPMTITKCSSSDVLPSSDTIATFAPAKECKRLKKLIGKKPKWAGGPTPGEDVREELLFKASPVIPVVTSKHGYWAIESSLHVTDEKVWDMIREQNSAARTVNGGDAEFMDVSSMYDELLEKQIPGLSKSKNKVPEEPPMTIEESPDGSLVIQFRRRREVVPPAFVALDKITKEQIDRFLEPAKRTDYSDALNSAIRDRVIKSKKSRIIADGERNARWKVTRPSKTPVADKDERRLQLPSKKFEANSTKVKDGGDKPFNNKVETQNQKTKKVVDKSSTTANKILDVLRREAKVKSKMEHWLENKELNGLGSTKKIPKESVGTPKKNTDSPIKVSALPKNDSLTPKKNHLLSKENNTSPRNGNPKSNILSPKSNVVTPTRETRKLNTVTPKSNFFTPKRNNIVPKAVSPKKMGQRPWLPGDAFSRSKLSGNTDNLRDPLQSQTSSNISSTENRKGFLDMPLLANIPRPRIPKHTQLDRIPKMNIASLQPSPTVTPAPTAARIQPVLPVEVRTPTPTAAPVRRVETPPPNSNGSDIPLVNPSDVSDSSVDLCDMDEAMPETVDSSSEDGQEETPPPQPSVLVNNNCSSVYDDDDLDILEIMVEDDEFL